MSFVRELIDKRNALVVREREIIDGAGSAGLTDEMRANLDTLDHDLTSVQSDLERALKAEGRDFKPTTDIPKNDPGKAPTRQSPEERAKKVNAEMRKFFLDETAKRIRMSDIEKRAGLEADLDDVGGYTVAKEQFNARLIRKIDDQVFLKGLASRFTVTNAESLGTPSLDSNATNATWGSELTVGANDTGLTYGKRELTPHPLSAYVTVSKKLIRASGIDIVAHVADRLAYALSIPAEQAYFNGFGANQPLGLFTVATNGVSTAQDFTSASSSKVISAFTDIIETQYKLKGAYWRNSQWAINRFHHKDIRNMTDGNGNPVWMPAGLGSVLNAQAYDRLLDRPVNMSEFVPVSTAYGSSLMTAAICGAGSTVNAVTGRVAVFGDFSNYWIADSLDLEIIRLQELKALTNQDLFVARLETDGAPVLSEAFAFLRLKGF